MHIPRRLWNKGVFFRVSKHVLRAALVDAKHLGVALKDVWPFSNALEVVPDFTMLTLATRTLVAACFFN